MIARVSTHYHPHQDNDLDERCLPPEADSDTRLRRLRNKSPGYRVSCHRGRKAIGQRLKATRTDISHPDTPGRRG